MSIPEEEPWEAEIAGLFAALPMVEPPTGFIDGALDHRPLNAGRTMAALFVASVAAVVVTVMSGAAAKTAVVPQIEELARRHTTVQAGIFGPPAADVDDPMDSPVRMPAGFQHTLDLAAEDIRQAFYARGDTSVSVFIQDGNVGWESLPVDGMTEIDGLRVWVDKALEITVVEASSRTVTIVGLPADEVADVLAGIPRTGATFGQRAQELVEAVTTQLGYVNLS